MFGSSEMAKQIEELRSEITSLLAALAAESARSAAVESALQEAQEVITTLSDAYQNSADRLSRMEEAVECATAEIKRRLEEVERKVPDPNRLLKLETRMDQQAEDVQTAIAALVIGIDKGAGASKSS